MKKSVIFMIFFALISKKVISAEILQEQPQEKPVEIQREILKNTDLEQQIRGDFRLFLEELYNERERGKNESKLVMKNMQDVLDDTKTLIDKSRKEIRDMSYSESRNLLVASIFLWISITIFIVMNLVFANNLKKELYFLRNGLLRSEIKDNMINLSNQLSDLNEKLDLINRS